MNYYNEIDPQAIAWLRELIKTGAIPPGDVDERSIEDVIPNELRGYGNAIVPQQAAAFIRAAFGIEVMVNQEQAA